MVTTVTLAAVTHLYNLLRVTDHFTYMNSFILHNTNEVNTIIIPSLQVKELMNKRFLTSAQGYIASRV